MIQEFDKVLDSGQRRDFSTGSRRDVRTGKGRMDLLSPVFVRRMARHLENGAVKYGDRNWELGQPLSTYWDSANRHGWSVMEGKTDEDHEAAWAWNVMAFMHTRAAINAGHLPKELDDMPDHSWMRPKSEVTPG